MLPGVDGPRYTLVRNGITIRRQAPIVGDYCETPYGRRALTECGYESAACQGDVLGCPRCRFTYCQHHFRTHVRGIVAPKQAWQTMMKRLGRELDRCAEKRGATPVHVCVPRIEAEDESLG